MTSCIQARLHLVVPPRQSPIRDSALDAALAGLEVRGILLMYQLVSSVLMDQLVDGGVRSSDRWDDLEFDPIGAGGGF